MAKIIVFPGRLQAAPPSAPAHQPSRGAIFTGMTVLVMAGFVAGWLSTSLFGVSAMVQLGLFLVLFAWGIMMLGHSILWSIVGIGFTLGVVIPPMVN